MKKAVCPYQHLILPHSTKNTHNRQNKHLSTTDMTK